MTAQAVFAIRSSRTDVSAADRPARSVATRTSTPPGGSGPATEELLRERDRLPVSHPARAAFRDRAIELNLPLAGRLARRYTGRGEPLNDLTQVAAMALVRAVDGYDSGREILFVGYAIPCIVGALKRHFRDTTWGLRVPRSMQELILAVRRTSGELAHELGRAPTLAELADQLHVTLDRLLVAQAAAQAYRPGSLDESLVRLDAGDRADLVRVLGHTDPRYAAVDDHLMLRTLVAALSDRDRRIVTMRFYEDMTQSQMAVELGISQIQVSRLLRRTLISLQLAMNALAAPRD